MMCAVQLILVINVPSDCLINFLNVCTHTHTDREKDDHSVSSFPMQARPYAAGVACLAWQSAVRCSEYECECACVSYRCRLRVCLVEYKYPFHIA